MAKTDRNIIYLPLLEHLSLSCNLLESLPDSISSMQNLKALDVSQNRIRYLPPAIGNLRNIQVLSANQNKLKSLPYSLGKLKTLQRLKCRRFPVGKVRLFRLERAHSGRNGEKRRLWSVL